MKVGRRLPKEDPFAKANAKLARFEKALKTIANEKLRVARSVVLACKHCGHKAPSSKWTFLRAQHYVRPYGCTQGDYWVNSSTEQCHLRCSKCGYEDRIYDRTDKKTLLSVIAEVGDFNVRDIFASVEVLRLS